MAKSINQLEKELARLKEKEVKQQRRKELERAIREKKAGKIIKVGRKVRRGLEVTGEEVIKAGKRGFTELQRLAEQKRLEKKAEARRRPKPKKPVREETMADRLAKVIGGL